MKQNEMFVGIAIRNFGSDHSGLSYPRHFPVSSIWINCPYFWLVSKGGETAEIISNILSLAKKLDLNMVAWGVECANQMMMLSDGGCHSHAREFSLPAVTDRSFRYSGEAAGYRSMQLSSRPPELLIPSFKAMRLENSVTSKDNQKNSHFANCVVFLTGKKGIPQPPSIAKETRHHSAENIWPETGANHGFGAGENDWLGAEAYVDSLR